MKKKDKNKISKKEDWYIFSIIMLTLSFFAALIVFLHNPLSHPIDEHLGQRFLGNDIIVLVEDCGSFSNTVSFNGDLIPSFAIEQNCYVKLKENSQTCVLRAKVFMFDNNNKLVNISCAFTADWEFLPDGYYYYKRPLTESVIQKFIQSITIPTAQAQLSSNTTYSIIITVETLPITADYPNLWGINAI